MKTSLSQAVWERLALFTETPSAIIPTTLMFVELNKLNILKTTPGFHPKKYYLAKDKQGWEGSFKNPLQYS